MEQIASYFINQFLDTANNVSAPLPLFSVIASLCGNRFLISHLPWVKLDIFTTNMVSQELLFALIFSSLQLIMLHKPFGLLITWRNKLSFVCKL